VLTGAWAQEAQQPDEPQIADPAPVNSEETSSDPPVEKPPAEPPVEKKPIIKVLSIEDISVSFITAEGKKKSSNSYKFGKKALDAVHVAGKQSVELTFTPKIDGSAAKPQQAMLMLSAAGGLAAYAVGKPKKDGSHTISVTQALVEKQIGKQGGDMKATLLLGDPTVADSISWDLGSLHVPEDPEVAPTPKYLSATFQPLNNVKPEIRHIFRAPDKQPPVVISLAFTGLALAPLGILLIALTQMGINFQGIPSGGSLWVLLFHGSIAGMLGLYLMFWLKLNLAQTMPLAVGIGLLVTATGYKALSALSADRLAAAGPGSSALEAKKTS